MPFIDGRCGQLVRRAAGFWIKTKNMDDYVLLESEKEFCELSNQIERT